MENPARTLILPQQKPFEALYVHIPFCKSKCAYCDFESRAISCESPEITQYVDSLILDIRAASKADLLGSTKTVYIGGGTPTHIGNKELSRLVYALSLSMHLTPEVECSLEVNPESLTEAMVKDLFALGVTRLSFGVQSFNDEELKLLGRVHSAQMAKDAIECARLRFSNISLDLMCGLPGQTKESFTYSLKTAIELGISHISVYPLTFEKRTPFYTMMQQGVFSESEEELSDIAAEMMILAQDLLEKAGFHRYEVASYAKPGFECTHNKAYWTGKPYLGFGSGAVSMLQNNQQRLRIRAGVVEEKLNVGEFLVEDLMLGMRMSEGVSEEAVENVQSFNSATHSVFENLIQQGLVKRENGRFKPTNKGWLWGNIIYSHILDLA